MYRFETKTSFSTSKSIAIGIAKNLGSYCAYNNVATTYYSKEVLCSTILFLICTFPVFTVQSINEFVDYLNECYYDEYNGENSCKNCISSTCQLNVIKLLILSHPNLCRGRWIYLKLHAFHIILKYF